MRGYRARALINFLNVVAAYLSDSTRACSCKMAGRLNRLVNEFNTER
jgi:hypothetical protein